MCLCTKEVCESLYPWLLCIILYTLFIYKTLKLAVIFHDTESASSIISFSSDMHKSNVRALSWVCAWVIDLILIIISWYNRKQWTLDIYSILFHLQFGDIVSVSCLSKPSNLMTNATPIWLSFVRLHSRIRTIILNKSYVLHLSLCW